MLTCISQWVPMAHGSQVVKAVFEDPELEVAGGISITHVGEDVGDIAGVGHLGLAIRDDLGAALDDIKPDVVVDFTTPKVIFNNAKTCIEHGVNMVVGTTGLTAEQRHELHALALERRRVSSLPRTFPSVLS